MNTPIIEQETVIRLGRAENEAIVYTSDTLMMARLDKYVEKFEAWQKVSESKFKDGTIADKTYKCPVDLVFLRKKSLRGRTLSAAQVEVLAKHGFGSVARDSVADDQAEQPSDEGQVV